MNEHWHWAERLHALGLRVRARQMRSLQAGGSHLALPVAREGGDTIYEIDRQVEEAIVAEIETWPGECLPLLLIAEGMGADGRRRFGDRSSSLRPVQQADRSGQPRWRCIVDPIDGTRGLMYDSRAAWFIAAVMPDRGESTSLADAVAAVLVELPTTRQAWADSFLAVQGTPTVARREKLDGSQTVALRCSPSSAATLAHGFASVVNFFPGIKVLAAELLERIAEATVERPVEGEALVFDDQYISTGGQMADLMLGRSRLICDVRPLLHAARRQQSPRLTGGLTAKPYDVAAELVARQAGVIVTDGWGQPLRPPLDVESGVSWIGYANETLKARIEPVIQAWLKEHGLQPSHPFVARPGDG